MLLMIIGLAILAGIGYLLWQENKKKTEGTGSPLVPIPPTAMGSTPQTTIIDERGNTVLLQSQNDAMAYLQQRLSEAGVSDDDIEDYIDWLIAKPRSNAEVTARINDLLG